MNNAADYRKGKTLIEVFNFAKKKAAVLKNRQLIRLFADDDFAFYLFKESNIIYIGYCCDGSDKEMPKFFKELWKQHNNTIRKKVKFYQMNQQRLEKLVKFWEVQEQP